MRILTAEDNGDSAGPQLFERGRPTDGLREERLEGAVAAGPHVRGLSAGGGAGPREVGPEGALRVEVVLGLVVAAPDVDGQVLGHVRRLGAYYCSWSS